MVPESPTAQTSSSALPHTDCSPFIVGTAGGLARRPPPAGRLVPARSPHRDDDHSRESPARDARQHERPAFAHSRMACALEPTTRAAAARRAGAPRPFWRASRRPMRYPVIHLVASTLLLWVLLSLARGNAALEVDLVKSPTLSEVPSPWSPRVTRGFSFLEIRMRPTNDLNVIDTQPLRTPDGLKADLPISPAPRSSCTARARRSALCCAGATRACSSSSGPCSVHDPEAAIDYAGRLQDLRRRYEDELLLVMRVYFEKPRTTVGWKGLVNDPHLNGSHDIGAGLRIARELLVRLADQGMPAATEVLDPIVPQYLADLVSLGGHRRAHDREPDASRDGERSLDARRLQERDRRRAGGRHPRARGGVATAQFPGHRRRRPGRDRPHRGQPRRARRAPRRQRGAELRRGARRGGGERARAGGRAVAHARRLQPRQQRQEPPASSRT